MGLVGLIPSCHWTLVGPKVYLVGISWVQNLVGILWVQNFFSWVICESKISCLGYFIGPKFSVVSILWIQNVFLWVFPWSNMFSCRYFVGPKFFLVAILWVFFSCGHFLVPNLFLMAILRETCKYISEKRELIISYTYNNCFQYSYVAKSCWRKRGDERGGRRSH